jgi:hypothetical protein
LEFADVVSGPDSIGLNINQRQRKQHLRKNQKLGCFGKLPKTLQFALLLQPVWVFSQYISNNTTATSVD